MIENLLLLVWKDKDKMTIWLSKSEAVNLFQTKK